MIRIMIAQLFLLKIIHEITFRWAFSENQQLRAEFGEWFALVMRGLVPVKVAPLPFSAAERQRLKIPVLFVFGKRDNLVGDPETARAIVQDIPDVRIEVLDAGHLMAAEKPQQVNALILDFCDAKLTEIHQ